MWKTILNHTWLFWIYLYIILELYLTQNKSKKIVVFECWRWSNLADRHRIQINRRTTWVGTFLVDVDAHVALHMVNRKAGVFVPPLFWRVNCLKIGWYVPLLSAPIFSLYSAMGKHWATDFHFAARMETTNLDKYANKTFENDCFIHLEVGKLALNFLLICCYFQGSSCVLHVIFW